MGLKSEALLIEAGGFLQNGTKRNLALFVAGGPARGKAIIFTTASIMFFCFSCHSFAEENNVIVDRLISSTFKSLAKAFVAVQDIAKLKKNNKEKLNRMSDDRFREHYRKICDLLQKLPDSIKNEYGITENMTKGQVMEAIGTLDKNRIYKIIDAVPDGAIGDQFRKYINKNGQPGKNVNLLEQINQLWKQIAGKVSTGN
jgi:hypothetical protein